MHRVAQGYYNPAWSTNGSRISNTYYNLDLLQTGGVLKRLTSRVSHLQICHNLLFFLKDKHMGWQIIE